VDFNPPQQAGVCDVCGGELYQRDDDKPETVRNRLDVYFKQTAPLIDYYRDAGLLHEVSGEGNIEVVNQALLEVIESLK
jgi:adenylate kinase